MTIFLQVNEVVKDFYLPLSKLKKVKEIFAEEMRLGLEANPPRKSVFYMCNTFVTEFPDGSEEGDILSMDLGGSNLRILLARLKPGKEPEYRVEPYDIDIKYRRGKPEVVNIMLTSFSIKLQQNKNHDLIEIKIFL